MSNIAFTLISVLAAIAIFLWCPGVVESQGIVTDGLVAFWTFDSSDIEGQVAVDLLGENNGTIVGNPRIVDGWIEEGLEFNGTTDYVDLGSANDFDLPVVTIECCFRTSSGSEMRIFAPRATFTNRWFLTMNEGGYIVASRSTAESQNQQTTGSFNDGQWHHVAGVIALNTDDIKIYVDGALENSVPVAEAWSVNGNCKIGAKAGSQYPFAGTIDEVRIYNRILTAGEVEQNYEARSQYIAMEPANRYPVTWGKIKSKY